MRAAALARGVLALFACDAAAPGSATPAAAPVVTAPVVTAPVVVAAGPGAAPPDEVPPSPQGRAERRQAALALLTDGQSVASLPLVDTSPGREFDDQLAYKLTPKIVIDRLRMPLVRQARATVVGPLEKDSVRRAVREHINDIRRCYDEGLAIEPRLGGRVTVDFTILGDGKVGTAAISESSLDDADVDACIEAALRRWRFPRPAGGGQVTVTYPFVLEPG